MRKKLLLILLLGIVANVSSVKAQDYVYLIDRDAQSELKKKIENLLRDYIDNRNLAEIEKQNQLSSCVEQAICLAPNNYMRDISNGKVGYKEDNVMLRTKTNFKQRLLERTTGSRSKVDYITSDMELIIKKVKVDYVAVTFEGTEYEIQTYYLRHLMLKKDRDELLQKIGEVVLAEQTKARKNNLESYYASVAQMKNGSPGPISVKKKEKKYSGKVPFNEYLRGGDVDTELDELLIFDVNSFQKVVNEETEKIKNLYGERKLNFYKAQSKEEGSYVVERLLNMQADTFGIWKNGSEWRYINLRTGEAIWPYIDLKNLGYGDNNISIKKFFESISYLKNIGSISRMAYDGTYSLGELLAPEYYKPEYPQLLCESLVGEKIYLLKYNMYDEIAKVETYGGGSYISGYKIITRSGKELRQPSEVRYETVSVKWYEQLQKFVGKKVIVLKKGPWIYQDDLADYDQWTVNNIEVKPYDKDSELHIYLSCGQKKMELDAMLCCMLLTHEFDFNNNNYEKLVTTTILSYDFVKAHAPYLTKEQKQLRDQYSNFVGETIAETIVDGVNEGKYKAMTLHQFRKAEPKAKQIKYEVKNGKATRVYHVKGYEIIFINDRCTSVTKI